jgi:hypothetical protein
LTTIDYNIVLYQSPDGAASLDVRLDHENVWLTQKQMAELFSRERSVVTKHLRNVFKEGELEEISVRAKYAHTAADCREPTRRKRDHRQGDRQPDQPEQLRDTAGKRI